MGHLSAHMAQHLLVMNLLVPIAVYLLSSRIDFAPLWGLWPWATVAQLALIWGWHTPSALSAAMHVPALMMLMHISLAGAASFFWGAIAGMPSSEQWRAAIALLITGKLFCLLGALMVFSPNLLFGGTASHLHPASLADQQMAGMIMLVACPLSYVSAGIVLASRWFLSLDNDARA